MITAEFLNGKPLLIHRLSLDSAGLRLTLSLDADIGGRDCRIVCETVSALQLADFSYPMQISGLRVTDRSAMGWQSDVRYEVRDYEEDSLRFFCGEITVVG